MNETTTPLWLKRGEERRLRAGHLWIYSNEVDTDRSPLKTLSPGQAVEIRDSHGKTLGCGYANPHSLICARLVSRDAEHFLSESLLVHRLKVALGLRERLYSEPYYRLVHGEGDGLPGLVVDRYGEVCVAQINTAGMEAVKADIIAALKRVIGARHVLIRADSSMRALEGLESYVEWADEPGPDELTVHENGIEFKVPALGGQKTGWFYDHRANRARLAKYCRGARVLDVFSYAGAWSLPALAAGAEEAHAVDSSAQALEYAAGNAERNGFSERFHTHHGDAMEVLRALRAERQHFDVIVLDPPAFIKRRKDMRQGIKGYQALNQAAMQLLSKDGLLVSASCSSHLPEDELVRIVLGSARHLDRTAQILELGQQAVDHPVHAALPETRYLKAVFARVLPAKVMP